MTDNGSGIQQSIIRYCRYQERCHQEVRNKLYELGCTTPEVENHIATIIESGLLNEERFACAYARGKFRLLQWGRVKIKQQLKLKKISDYCIRKAMKEIREIEYEGVLNKLFNKKYKELHKERSKPLLKQKIYRYLIQKGFEPDLVTDIINKHLKK